MSWSKILAVITTGERNPSGSKTEATSWRTSRFVLAWILIDDLKLNESC
jgi:hypothetical protein